MRVRNKNVRLGVIGGAGLSVAAALAYVFLFHERGSLFYTFAVSAFVGGPLVGGLISAAMASERRRRAFFAASRAVFGLVALLFVVAYVVTPQFSRTSVDLTSFRDASPLPLVAPRGLAHSLPDGREGIRIATDGRTDVVATVDEAPPFASTVFLVDRNDGNVIRQLRFDNDVIAASIADGTVVIYNDKLGYLLDARTGESETNLLLIDNYGGLSESDRPFFSRASTGRWYMETTAVLSAWRVDGRVWSRRRLTFNCLALGCFVDGRSGEVTRLKRAPEVNSTDGAGS